MSRKKNEDHASLQKKQRRSVGDDLYNDLKDYIATCPPHHALASEQEFCEQYEISRVTVRRMMQRLVDEKLIYKERGRGIFVADNKVVDDKPQTIIYCQGCNQLTHPFYAEKLRGVLEAAEKENITVQLCTHRNEKNGTTPGLMQSLHNTDIIGIIIPYISNSGYDNILKQNSKAKIVVTVSVGHELNPEINTLIPDSNELGQLAAIYMKEQNAQKVMIIGRDQQATYGAIESLDNAGIDYQKVLLCHTDDCTETLSRIKHYQPDGLIVDDDFTCRNIIDAIKQDSGKPAEQQYKIASLYNKNSDLLPENIAKIQFDGFELGAKCVYLLKSLHQHPELTNFNIKLRPLLLRP